MDGEVLLHVRADHPPVPHVDALVEPEDLLQALPHPHHGGHVRRVPRIDLEGDGEPLGGHHHAPVHLRAPLHLVPVVPKPDEVGDLSFAVGAREVVVEDGRLGGEGTHHPLVDQALQGVLPAEQAVHGPVEEILVEGGVPELQQIGGGGEAEPVEKPILAGGFGEAVDDHGLDPPGDLPLSGDVSQGLDDHGVEAELAPNEVGKRLPPVLPGAADVDVVEVGEEGRGVGGEGRVSIQPGADPGDLILRDPANLVEGDRTDVPSVTDTADKAGVGSPLDAVDLEGESEAHGEGMARG